MSTAPNPLTGAAWSDPSQGGQTQQPNFMSNPLFQLPQTSGSFFGGGPLGNPGNYGNPQGGKETSRNVMANNVVAGQLKNILAPQFAQLMSQYGGQAGGFFKQLMDLGSPYYRQKQQESFTQGQQQNQNASALAQQQVARQGYGYTPSGAGAAVAGGQAQQGAQSISEQFLQNLFQNEAMQLQGAQGLQGLAGLFNPTQLLGGTSAGADPVISSNFFQNFASMLNSITGAGSKAAGGFGAPGQTG